jgi:hypothetical protein
MGAMKEVFGTLVVLQEHAQNLPVPLQDYEEAYYAKFDRKPRLVRKQHQRLPQPHRSVCADGVPAPHGLDSPHPGNLPPLAGSALEKMHKLSGEPVRVHVSSTHPITGVGLAKERCEPREYMAPLPSVTPMLRMGHSQVMKNNRA